MIGGSVLSLLCVLFPPLYGEGYDTIKAFTMGKTHFVIQNSFFKYFDVNVFDFNICSGSPSQTI